MSATNDDIDLSIYDDVPPARQPARVEMTPADVMNHLTGESGMGRRYEDSILNATPRPLNRPQTGTLVTVPVKSIHQMLMQTPNNRPFLTANQREKIGTAVKSSSRGMVPKPKPTGGSTRKKRRMNKMKRMKTKGYNKSRARKSTRRRYKNSH
jgi:hypothetical protein